MEIHQELRLARRGRQGRRREDMQLHHGHLQHIRRALQLQEQGRMQRRLVSVGAASLSAAHDHLQGTRLTTFASFHSFLYRSVLINLLDRSPMPPPLIPLIDGIRISLPGGYFQTRSSISFR